MELHDYLTVLRRSWLLIVATTLLGAVLALGFSMLSTPLYQAKSQLFISMADDSSDGANSAYTGALFAQQRVKSYTAIVDSPAVLAPVIEDLDLSTTPTALAARVSATAPPATVLIDVLATDTDPTMAKEIANAVAASFAAEIVRLETPNGGNTAAVKPSVTMPAVLPRAPISPRTQLNLVLGALLGLMVGVGVAVARHVLDTSVKTATDVTGASGATLLGSVTFDSQAKSNPLVSLETGSPRAEAFRTMRTNLQYVDIDRPPTCVVITSAVPGEGKSTTACNLAIALAQAGSKVLLVEADLRRPRVADYLGIDGTIGLTDLLIGQRESAEVIAPWRRDLMDVLPSGAIPPNPSELLGSHQMAELLREFAANYDVVVLDAPPVLPVTDAAVLTSLADGAILVAKHGSTTREQVALSADALRQVGGRLLGVVINFVPNRGGRGGYGYGYGYGGQYGSGGSENSRRVLSDEDVAPGAVRSSRGPSRASQDIDPWIDSPEPGDRGVVPDRSGAPRSSGA